MKRKQDKILSIHFFELLGWDISNKEGLSQTYREVIHEDKRG